MKKLSFFILVFTGFFSAFALDFNISPNDDGTVDLFAGIDWEYSDSLYSAIDGKYSNIGSVADSTLDGVTTYIDTSGTIISVGADLLGYRVRNDNMRLDLSLNVQYEIMDILEIGYIDNGSIIFLMNDRQLNLLLPRIKGTFRNSSGNLIFSMGGEYSPWLKVDLVQDLAITGYVDRRTFTSTQTASNAFSLNGKLRYQNMFITPQLSLEYDHLGIAYDVYTSSGVATIDSLIQSLTGEVLCVLNFIDLNGVHPSLAFQKIWDWTTDRSLTASDPVLSEEFKLTLGFEI